MNISIVYEFYIEEDIYDKVTCFQSRQSNRYLNNFNSCLLIIVAYSICSSVKCYTSHTPV